MRSGSVMGKACIIHRLCVSPEVQNRGIGKIVLNHIENQLQNIGFESVRLDVFSENPYAISLYKKADTKGVDMQIGEKGDSG